MKVIISYYCIDTLSDFEKSLLIKSVIIKISSYSALYSKVLGTLAI